MRAERGRKKKLIVAFHFQFSDRAKWKCDACRASGLEIKRRCGFLAAALESPARIVWARRHVSTAICPKSLVSAQSWQWIEEFYAARRGRGVQFRRLPARDAEAFLVIENELAAENNNGHR